MLLLQFRPSGLQVLLQGLVHFGLVSSLSQLLLQTSQTVLLFFPVLPKSGKSRLFARNVDTQGKDLSDFPKVGEGTLGHLAQQGFPTLVQVLFQLRQMPTLGAGSRFKGG